MSEFRFVGKKILIISPEPWDYIKVSKHHYAETLASKNNAVYFLDPPDKTVKGIECKKVADNLVQINYKDPYTGVRFFPKEIRNYLNKRLYEKFEQAAQINFDVVFLFENSRFYDLDFLPRTVLSVYFQVDEDQNFHPAVAAKSAGVVIAINDIIQNILSAYRKEVFKISHGFSGHFSGQSLGILKGEIKYNKPTGKIKAYYIGNLDHGFIDTDLLTLVIHKNQNVDFILAGPFSENGKLYKSIKNYKNVQLLGKVPARSIQELLDNADILLLTYNKKFFSSAHKMMEYLASGKAIVTTSVKGYPDDPDLFYYSETAEKFFDLFNEICTDIEKANSPDKMQKRIQFAMDNTYEAKIKQIEELVNTTRINNKKR